MNVSEELTKLTTEGLGRLIPKARISSRRRANVFLRPSPDLLGDGHQLLKLSGYTWLMYCGLFNRVDLLSDEELTFVRENHPDIQNMPLISPSENPESTIENARRGELSQLLDD